MCNRVRLGTVRAPSGILVVIDAGYAGLWCRTTKDFDDDSDWPVSDKDCRAIKNSVDIRVIGANAAEAGKTFDRQWHPLSMAIRRSARRFVEMQRLFQDTIAHQGFRPRSSSITSAYHIVSA